MSTERKIDYIVDAQMSRLKKLKKADLQDVLYDLMRDYFREFSNDTLNDMYYEIEYGKRK